LLGVKVSGHLQADAELLFAAVQDAGSMGLELSRQNVRNWAKPDGSTVTEADLKIDAFLKSRLHDTRPDYGWLSEESVDTPARLENKRLWIVDPIDGTNSFVNGTDGWCIGAALIEDGQPILAALYQPKAEMFYAAVLGHGAFCNKVLMMPHDGESLAGAKLLGTGRALNSFPGVSADASPQIPLLLRLAHVASGKADIALSFGLRNDWDLAAGDLLVQEAGGVITQVSGAKMIYNLANPKQNGLLAAGKVRHGAALKILETI
jgi:myo-inositol-1(or 4)-monophosphatase